MVSKKGNFRLKTIKKNDIVENNLNKGQLWFILMKDGPIGPFLQSDLIKFLELHPDFPRKTKVSNYANPQWIPLFESLILAKKGKKIVVEPRELPADDIFLLINGQKNGPYSQNQIQEKINLQEILFNHLISVDHGSTWLKIYEHAQFSRRIHPQHHRTLPPSPKEDTFIYSQNEANYSLQEKPTDNKTEGLIGLAHVGKSTANRPSGPLRDQGNPPPLFSIDEEEFHDSEDREEIPWQSIMVITCFVVLLIVGIMRWQNKETKPIPVKKAKIIKPKKPRPKKITTPLPQNKALPNKKAKRPPKEANDSYEDEDEAYWNQNDQDRNPEDLKTFGEEEDESKFPPVNEVIPEEIFQEKDRKYENEALVKEENNDIELDGETIENMEDDELFDNP